MDSRIAVHGFVCHAVDAFQRSTENSRPPGGRRLEASQPELDVVATTTTDDNYPNEASKHIRRRSAPGQPTAALRRGPRLADLLCERRQRSIFTGITPLLWRRETPDSTEL